MPCIGRRRFVREERAAGRAFPASAVSAGRRASLDGAASASVGVLGRALADPDSLERPGSHHSGVFPLPAGKSRSRACRSDSPTKGESAGSQASAAAQARSGLGGSPPGKPRMRQRRRSIAPGGEKKRKERATRARRPTSRRNVIFQEERIRTPTRGRLAGFARSARAPTGRGTRRQPTTRATPSLRRPPTPSTGFGTVFLAGSRLLGARSNRGHLSFRGDQTTLKRREACSRKGQHERVFQLRFYSRAVRPPVTVTSSPFAEFIFRGTQSLVWYL